MKRILTLLTFSLCCTLLMAQSPQKKFKRLDAVAERKALKDDGKLQTVYITCIHAEQVAVSIQKDGYHACAVSQGLLTATVPASYLKTTLNNDERIKRIYGTHPASFFMDKAREDIGVETIRNSSEFETPFTGKGVIVAMIDGGFRYDHIAFKDAEGNSRIKMIWNHSSSWDGDPNPTNVIPEGVDKVSFAEGHGSHTANIAAGSIISENNFSGIAPEADLVLISIDGTNANTMEELKQIDEFAEKQGQPYVVNMSFGNLVGSHDGLSPYDQFINEMAAKKNGRALVYSAGNSGSDNIHVAYTFENDGQVALSTDFFGPNIDLWRTEPDGEQHLSVKIYNLEDDVLTELSADDFFTHEICDYNNKEHVFYSSNDEYDGIPIIVISGKKGDSFNAWTDNTGDFVSFDVEPLGMTTIGGDSWMSTDDNGHCAANAFCVANYVTRGIYTDFNGNQHTPDDTTVGALSQTSSKGPTTNSAIRKPDLAAPGSVILSAIDLMEYYEGFTGQRVTRNGVDYLYDYKNGTSMAAPMVTGSIALWLQANPNLSCAQLHEIVSTTCRHDTFTGDNEWSPEWGYGKLDTFAGLKKALQMADNTGIPCIYGSEQPISLKKLSDRWQVLFNNNEPNADIAVYDQQGRVCQTTHLTQLQRGQEVSIPFNNLRSGVYVIKISTPKSELVRKLIVAQ